MTATLCRSEHCTGCMACLAVCRRGAIKTVIKGGFVFPYIDSDMCNNCGRCHAVCPSLSERHTEEFGHLPEAYILSTAGAVYSSSGGFCTELAEYVIENGGMVAGCVMDGTQARHILTGRSEDLDRMRGSKYIQSDTSGIYLQVREALKSRKTVLFTGTPCQVEAVRRIAGKKLSDSLITIDLICHGVSSADFLGVCLRNKDLVTERSKTEILTFRSRRSQTEDFCMEVRLTDGDGNVTEHSISLGDSLFYRGFAGPAIRESCIHCQHAGAWPRKGDFTCGDPWGLLPAREEYRGKSLVLVNTEKAAALIRELSPGFTFMSEIPFSKAMTSQLNMQRPTPAHPWRREFRHLMAQGRFPADLHEDRKALRERNVAVLNFSFERSNYGAVLTCMALCRAVSKADRCVTVIDYHLYDDSYNERNAFDGFRYRELPLTRTYRRTDDLTGLNDLFSTFIVGSDQVLNFSFVRNDRSAYYLNFTESDRKTIVYAGSFGRDAEEYLKDLDERDRKFSSLCLRRMSAVSVREKKSGLEICRALNVKAQAVCDPVFLLPAEEWKNIASAGSGKGGELVTYSLMPDSAISRLHLPDGFADRRDFLADGRQSPYDWLKAVSKCRLFVTNSFHGTCFALIFNRPFLVYGYSERSLVRIRDLLEEIDPSLERRIVTSLDEDIPIEEALENIPDPDWSGINAVIASMAARSTDFLLRNLHSEPDCDEIKRKETLKSELRAAEEGKLRREILKYRLKRFLYSIQKALLPTERKIRHYERAKRKLRALRQELRYMLIP